jgi:5-methyltetrahydrofolate--homocysteine methyltransferase
MTGLDELLRGGPVLMDGATGTMLQALGLPPGLPPEIWNVECPDEVRKLAAGYAEAGSVIVQTNTFGANAARLEKYGMEGRVRELNVRGATLAKEGMNGEGLVAGSVGPSGLCTGFAPPPLETLRGIFEAQCKALAEGGVDLISLETFYDIMELKAAMEAVCTCELPFVASMTFQETPRGFFTMMGVTPAEALGAARAAGAAAAGANCTLGSEAMGRLIVVMAEDGPGPLLMKPNAGQPVLEGGRTVYRQAPAQFAADVARAVKAGARVVGGCCGTTPDFIRALASILESGDES